MHVVVASAELGSHGHLIGRMTEPPTPGKPGCSPIYQWRYVLDELARCTAERFVLSSERCIEPEHRRGVIRRLSWLQSEADTEIEVVGFVRSQWQWAESYWCMRVACGLELRRFEESLPGWFADMRVDYYDLDYNRLFAPWCESFGKVTVRPLEAGHMPQALLVNFLSLIGVHDERLFRATTKLRLQNARLGAKNLEIRRLVAVMLANEGVEQRRRASAVYGLDLRGVLQEDWPFAGWTREQVLAINDDTAEPNGRFARDYGIDDSGILFRDELPQDFDNRRRTAAWEDLTVDEQRAARERVIRTLNLDIHSGLRSGTGVAGLPGLPPRRKSLGPARWLAMMTWRRGKSLVAHVWRLTRAMAQIRLSRQGLLFLRWARWEAYEFWRREVGAFCSRLRRGFEVR